MSSLAFRGPKDKARVALSVTPLIDVLFLLIIFFTLTSTFKRVGELELQLPESTTADPSARENPLPLIELIAEEDGALWIDGEPVSFDTLAERLDRIRAERPDDHVMIKAEAGVDHGDVVRLLDAVRGARFPGVAIGTHVKSDAPVR